MMSPAETPSSEVTEIGSRLSARLRGKPQLTGPPLEVSSRVPLTDNGYGQLSGAVLVAAHRQRERDRVVRLRAAVVVLDLAQGREVEHLPLAGAAHVRDVCRGALQGASGHAVRTHSAGWILMECGVEALRIFRTEALSSTQDNLNNP